MKILKKIAALFLIPIILIASSSIVSANENIVSSIEDFGYVIEKGIEKKIRFVSEEEYYSDTSSDFLIIDASQSEKYKDYKTLSLSPASKGKEIKLMIAGAVAGILANEVWIFIGGSAITQAMFAKGVAIVASAGFSPATIVVMGILLLMLTSDTASQPTVYNSVGCVWNGVNAYSGVWLCPMRI